ncbi:hypothetical protein PGTUg99_018646 [Puccinia graminis f. sp. tritici]|uniref:Uncharacterized protein n=1 Tax=Puccinia graminis f. sp. tritici TaxID=56615 RepID=A0A5B0Q3X3_PUCGR|nr:hypothetical protein PGTUg99_018646 [Puccinia graminis f. sp. tritici]
MAERRWATLNNHSDNTKTTKRKLFNIRTNIRTTSQTKLNQFLQTHWQDTTIAPTLPQTKEAEEEVEEELAVVITKAPKGPQEQEVNPNQQRGTLEREEGFDSLEKQTTKEKKKLEEANSPSSSHAGLQRSNQPLVSPQPIASTSRLPEIPTPPVKENIPVKEVNVPRQLEERPSVQQDCALLALRRYSLQAEKVPLRGIRQRIAGIATETPMLSLLVEVEGPLAKLVNGLIV